MKNKPEISVGERALSSKILEAVQADEKHWEKKAFKRMRENARYASGKQWPTILTDEDDDQDDVVINITQRHVQQSTSAVYARNPKAVAAPRESLNYQFWDGTNESLTAALAALQMEQETGKEVSPEAKQVVEDALRGTASKRMKERIGKTLELLYSYELSQQDTDFKQEMKQLVRRARVAGVGYAKAGYRHLGGLNADENDLTGGMKKQLAEIQSRIDENRTEGLETNDLEAEEYELQLLIDATSESPRALKEGLLITFPESDAIIPDRGCTSLAGFVGAIRVSQRYELTPDEIENIYDRNVRDDIRAKENTPEGTGDSPLEGDTIKVYEVWNSRTGLVYEVADGVEGFLRKPYAPESNLDDFWPWEALMFNRLPDDEGIFPKSDVDFLRPVQDEYNRTRQAFREHRFANRPGHFVREGTIDQKAVDQIACRVANDIIPLQIDKDTNINNVLMPIATVGINPADYTTAHLVEDVSRVTGSSEPAFTGQGGSTATGDSIAENARMSSMASNVDDLDAFLTRLAKKSAKILFTHRQEEDVRRIVGPGAAWPEYTSQEIADEVTLVIKAGSSGRPNKAAELQNFERLAPMLLQLPGISPQWLAEQAIMRMDDSLDISEAIMENMPSIIAQNSMKQVGTGDPSTSPEAQGGQGGLNAQAPEGVDAIPRAETPELR